MLKSCHQIACIYYEYGYELYLSSQEAQGGQDESGVGIEEHFVRSFSGRQNLVIDGMS